MAKGLPYAGWYNGIFELQLANGTYADFRDLFVKKVELHKMKKKELDEMDKQWEAVPLEERMRRRTVVVEDSTPKLVTYQTHDGVISAYKSAPDEGNNVYRARLKANIKKERKVPQGTLTEDNNPLKRLVPVSA